MKKLIWFASAIILISFIVGILLYPQMPDRMASHWGAGGEVDGYMSKFWGLFLMPIIVTIMVLLFIFLPKIDPLKKNMEKFRPYYEGFILIMVVFLTYIYGLTIAWNMNYRFDMTLMIVPAMSILFYYCGILLEHAKRNWFIGIKTPWTLSSDVVWKKTHKLGAKLFKISAVVLLSGIFIPDYAFFLLILVIIAALYPIFYSYFEYKKIKKHSNRIK
jgi:uncharacterized membrane protein